MFYSNQYAPVHSGANFLKEGVEMLKECVDNYIKQQQDYNISCIIGIDFWLNFIRHDEPYCKAIMNAAYSDYIAVNPYC